MLIVEDIVDTGLTLHYLQDILTARGPKSVRTAASSTSPHAARSTCAWSISDSRSRTISSSATASTTREQYRNLPHIGGVESSVNSPPARCRSPVSARVRPFPGPSRRTGFVPILGASALRALSIVHCALCIVHCAFQSLPRRLPHLLRRSAALRQAPSRSSSVNTVLFSISTFPCTMVVSTSSPRVT